MFGRQPRQELNERLIGEVMADHRATQLEKDPSDIPGMTQAELNDFIDTGSIPSQLLNDVLNHGR